MDSDELVFISPVFKERPWGGCKLHTKWGYTIPSDKTGECWAVSAHPNGDCMVQNGKYEGKTLSKLWKENPELFGEKSQEEFPILIKLLDADEDLSVQVHPDDEYAGIHENGSKGKFECWYVLDALPESKIVFGHNAKSRKEFMTMVKEGKWEKLIHELPVKKGDFIVINPGMLHAIEGGIQILETQQSSDVTYRVYDYDRIVQGKKRQLHIKESLDIVKVPGGEADNSILNTDSLMPNRLNELVSNKYFKVLKCNVDSRMEFKKEDDYLLVSIIEGYGCINGTCVEKGDHFIIPKYVENVYILGNVSFIASTENRHCPAV